MAEGKGPHHHKPENLSLTSRTSMVGKRTGSSQFFSDSHRHAVAIMHEQINAIQKKKNLREHETIQLLPPSQDSILVLW